LRRGAIIVLFLVAAGCGLSRGAADPELRAGIREDVRGVLEAAPALVERVRRAEKEQQGSGIGALLAEVLLYLSAPAVGLYALRSQRQAVNGAAADGARTRRPS